MRTSELPASCQGQVQHVASKRSSIHPAEVVDAVEAERRAPPDREAPGEAAVPARCKNVRAAREPAFQ